MSSPVPKKAPKVDLDSTRERLTRLGLLHASEHVSETLAAAAKDSWPPHRFLDRLLEDELTVREERRLKTALRLSGLPTGQTLGNFDFAFQPSVERNRIATLATCAWIREKESLLMQGPPGVGKTHLAIALGVLLEAAQEMETKAALPNDGDGSATLLPDRWVSQALSQLTMEEVKSRFAKRFSPTSFDLDD